MLRSRSNEKKSAFREYTSALTACIQKEYVKPETRTKDKDDTRTDPRRLPISGRKTSMLRRKALHRIASEREAENADRRLTLKAKLQTGRKEKSLPRRT
jgi:hypothetical protein